MANLLQQHFPMLWDRDEVLAEIQENEHLLTIWQSWETHHQEEFLDYCTGVRGIKLLYDHFFKAIINPGTTPERLEEILSLILKTRVKIVKVLPADSTRIAAENSLLVLDIVVELADGSIANVEVQKIGYAFPGERSACYSADLLLRQYKRVKSEMGKDGKKFSYRDIKKVYTIVLFEDSVREFHKFPDQYIHRMKQKSDTGIEFDLLQEYVFIALDIFKEILHNKGVRAGNKLEAWLTFLSVDEPEIIVQLIKTYPEFEALYREVYKMCRNMEDFMGIFSEELAILDKNTVDYMIDEMQNTIDAQAETIDSQIKAINGLEESLTEKDHKLSEKDSIISELQKQIELLKDKSGKES